MTTWHASSSSWDWLVGWCLFLHRIRLDPKATEQDNHILGSSLLSACFAKLVRWPHHCNWCRDASPSLFNHLLPDQWPMIEPDPRAGAADGWGDDDVVAGGGTSLQSHWSIPVPLLKRTPPGLPSCPALDRLFRREVLDGARMVSVQLA